jgi:type IV secretory pathway protease TraF
VTAVKRVVGLPGEAVSIREGDLAIDGRVVLKSPSELAAVAMAVARHAVDARGAVQVPAAEVLDDADFAAEVSRPLLPVPDVGLVAIVRLRDGMPGRVSIDVGQRRITWRLDRPGRSCLVAGRLDGHLVAVAWPLAACSAPERLAIPAASPSTWSHAEPWPLEDAGGDSSPALAFAIADGDGSRPHLVVVEQVAVWRDVLLRPAGDGREEWHLNADELFVLGDFPSGSRDSRHWGPVRESAFRYRIARVAGRRD